MKKLDDIPKKNPFKVPDGYFEKLPIIIQSRMVKPQREKLSGFGFGVRYALPVIVLIVAGIFLLRPSPSIESQLDEIDSSQIALYLEDTYDNDQVDIESDWTNEELMQLEEDVYSSMELLDDIDL